ncbi:MAG: DNA repair protein RecO [Bryobacterales bacterium]|nr:DNA repair protein RecO [Bryobacterales bacterium]
MPARVSESLVIRSFPLGEADLIVSYLTRDQGKLRGVAKRARRPKSSFGAGLERLSHVRMVYYQKENRELTTLDSCELIRSPFGLLSSYETGIALDYMAELTEELLPLGEPNEKHFRLLLSVLEYLHAAKGDAKAVWPSTLYFLLWSVRLAGFLPGLRGRPESMEVAKEIFERPVKELTARDWSRLTCSDLRHGLHRAVEDHIERRLQVAPMLEGL